MSVLIDRRGRPSKYKDNTVLNLLIKNKTPIGFNYIHRELGGKLSKSTLSKNLNLLVSQHRIKKIKNGKYQIRIGQDFVNNIENLRTLFNNLNQIIPNLKDAEEAYIGLYLWTIIFQDEVHPSMYWSFNLVSISEELPNSKHKKEIETFFQSLRQPSIFLDNLYLLFFDFCRKFSPKILDSVMYDVIHNTSQKLNSNNIEHIKLSKLLHKEIFIQRFDYETYYGTALCNAILDVKKDGLTKNTVRKIKELNLSENSFTKTKIFKFED